MDNHNIPGWVYNEVMAGDLYRYIDERKPLMEVSVNGKTIDATPQDGYITLDGREWKLNDKIEINLDMLVRKVMSHELVEANKGKIALERGPLVYCAEEVDKPDGVLNLKLSKNDALESEFDSGLLGGLGLIKGTVVINSNPVAFKAVPYYAWAHREIGEMAVWLAVN